MSDLVFSITQLDKDLGTSVGRYIYIVGDEPNYLKQLNKIINDKRIKGTFSTARKVYLT